MTFDEVLTTVTRHGGALMASPASSEQVAACRHAMALAELLPLPQGYVAFLQKHDGFAWNGIEFYGTQEQPDADSDYFLIDIVRANTDFADYETGLAHCVFLGRSDEDIFVYNTRNRRYEVLDRTGRDVMEDYASFEELFAGEVGARM